MDGPRMTLDDQLCFALYAATNAVTRSYKTLLEPIGLTYPQFLVMLTLWQDGRCNTRRLSRRLNLPANAITPLVDRLEARGYLSRQRDRDDRRVVHLHLTEDGRQLEAAAAEVQARVTRNTGLGPDAFDALRTDLRALVGRMEPQGSVHVQMVGESRPVA